MKDKIDQRNWHRELFIEPIQGVIYRNSVIAPVESPSDINRSTGKPFSFLYVFVSVHNISPRGALVESSSEFDPGSSLEFMAYDSYEGKWKPNNAHVVWTERNSEKGQFLAGLEFLPEIQDGDLKFLINSELLECIPQEDIFFILNCLSHKIVLADERLILKGEIGDALYLIQSGSCSVKKEKAGETIQVARIQKGNDERI